MPRYQSENIQNLSPGTVALLGVPWDEGSSYMHGSAGVSHFEPGGMSTRDALSVIQNFEGHLIGADIVEVNPERDSSGMTAMVGAKVLKEIAGRLLEN